MESPSFKSEKIFQTEEAYQIFLHPGRHILKSEEVKIKVAKKLEKLGFFTLIEDQTVVCVQPDEYELSDAPDYECREIIRVSKNPKPYSEADHIICDRCGHEFYLSASNKEITSFYRLRPNNKAILQLFEERMTEQNILWQPLELGCYGLFQGANPTILPLLTFCNQVSPRKTVFSFVFLFLTVQESSLI